MNPENIILNTDFMSTHDVTMLANLSVERAQKNPKADSQRIYHVLYTFYLLRTLLNGQKDVKISYELFSPYDTMGIVSVVGAQLSFANSELFMKALGLANNFEVYPKTDGTLQMDFTFHGLIKQCREK